MKKIENKRLGKQNYFLPLAIVYIIIPNLIFLITWMRPSIGISAAAITLIATGYLFRKISSSGYDLIISKKDFSFILCAAFIWVLFGGVGAVFPQSQDYIKHNLIFHDLVDCSWPVHYTLLDGTTGYLCYGLGYYLVPSLCGKLMGAAVVPWITFVWTFLGTVLFFYWVAIFNKRPRFTLIIFLLFAVTGILWLTFKSHAIQGLVWTYNMEDRVKNLGLLFSFNDNFTRFEFQPQHALAGWLGVAVLYEMLWVRKNATGSFFIWTCLLVWSPLSCLGILLVPLASLRRVRWQEYFEPINLIAGGVLLIIMGIYYQGHIKLADSGPIWQFSNHSDWILLYPIFLILELSSLIFLILLDLKYKILNEIRPLFLIGTAFLILLPLYKIGFYSDLRLEASGPALVFIALAASLSVGNKNFTLKSPLYILLMGSMLIGAIYPLTRPWQNLLTNKSDYSYGNIIKNCGFNNVSQLTTPDFYAGAQYLGRTNSIAAHLLLR